MSVYLYLYDSGVIIIYYNLDKFYLATSQNHPTFCIIYNNNILSTYYTGSVKFIKS